MSRNVSLLNSVFASDAETVVPISPAVGIPYRNPNLTSGKAGQGWPFSTVVDSADFNELMFRVTGLMDFVEKTGGIIWSPLTDYPVGAFVRDEQLIFWEATQASGPNNGGSQNPYVGSQYWKVAEICRVQDTNSIDLSFVNQVLTAALRLAPASGLNAGVDGVRVQLNPSVTNAIKIVNGGLLVEDAGTGGKVLGEIFAYPGATPPAGAYLLNGQTIAGCNELYPKFWEWLVENAGVMTATPVYKPWTMPALTADGTVGGDEYAVEASGAASSGYNAYKSFDGALGATSGFANISGVESGWLTWYSPVTLKFTQVLFSNQTSGSSYTNRIVSFAIYGSNDNATWTELASGAYNSTANSATQLVEIPESKFNGDTPGFQYLKIEGVNGGGSNIDFPEITIYGQEYLYTDSVGNGDILTMSEDTYEAEIASAGVCGGFVLDTGAGSVRLPTLVNGTLWGADSSTVGQSLAAGLPNIEGSIGDGSGSGTSGGFLLVNNSPSTGALSSTQAMKLSGMAGGSVYGFNKLSLDASQSNPIYGKSDTVQPPAIRVSWCIQVYNAATALSEQESAQLASLMQTKAQTDLANVTANVDFVVESWNAADGSGWYRKYRSGWIEQGGIYNGAITGSNQQVTFQLPVEMADTKYNVLRSFDYTGQTNSTVADTGVTSRIIKAETTFFTAWIGGNYGWQNCRWEVKGYSATE